MKTSQISSTGELPKPNKRVGLLPALIAAVIVAAAMSLCLGSVRLPLSEVLSALAGRNAGSVAGRIVLYTRLPRTLGCLLSGAALAVSGAVIQTVLQNPLAAPNVIGVNAGAGFAVTLCSAIAPVLSAAFLPLAAFAGALFGVLLVLLIGERTGASRLTLILSGVAVSAVFTGAVELVVTLVPDALGAYTDFRIGGFSGVTMRRVGFAAILFAPAILAVFSLSDAMDVLALGEETARSLGMRTRPVRIGLLTGAAALAGAAVSIAGLLGFVGLIVPHAVRKYAQGSGRRLLLLSALGGAALVAACDLLARLAFAPYELPVGVLLSFVGGPFFLCVILRQRGGRRRA